MNRPKWQGWAKQLCLWIAFVWEPLSIRIVDGPNAVAAAFALLPSKSTKPNTTHLHECFMFAFECTGAVWKSVSLFFMRQHFSTTYRVENCGNWLISYGEICSTSMVFVRVWWAGKLTAILWNRWAGGGWTRSGWSGWLARDQPSKVGDSFWRHGLARRASMCHVTNWNKLDRCSGVSFFCAMLRYDGIWYQLSTYWTQNGRRRHFFTIAIFVFEHIVHRDRNCLINE